MEVSQRMWTWLRMPLDVAQLGLLHLQAPLMVWKQNPKDLSATFTQMLMKYLTQNTGHCCSMDLQTASPVEALEGKTDPWTTTKVEHGSKIDVALA